MSLAALPANSQTAQKKIQALIFLGTDCPISQNYTGTINKLQQKYPQVKFLGVLPASNNHDKKSFKREYQKLVAQYDITATPEVVLIDVNSNTCYRGAIDDWYFELGHRRAQVAEHYLSNAIDDLLARRRIRISRTKPVGCILSRRK
jgi:hypothetical protein